MSMRDYAVDEYGLLLDEKTMKALAKKICEGYTDEDYDEDPYGFNEDVEAKFGNIDYISNFTGQAFKLTDNGDDDYRSETAYFNDDTVYILAADNAPSLFKAAYANIDEMIAEFRRQLGNYLPNFAYRSHIKHLVGTYYG